MIDLRNKTANLKIKPTHTQHRDFNLALADYLTKELKRRGFQTSKLNDLAVRVHVGNRDQFKYHSMVIDCLDGNMYMIDQRNKERRVGKLLAFNGTHTSDAFHCLKTSIYKILRKLNVYTVENENFKQFKTADLRRKDLRKKSVKVADLRRKDLRKKKIVADLRKKKVLDLRGAKTTPNKLESVLLSVSEMRKAKNEVSYASNSATLFNTVKGIWNSGYSVIKRLLRK